MRVGILTGGGDCPGLNAVIRAIVRKGELVYGDELVGFLDAWDGVMDRRTIPLDVSSLRGMLPRGGTLLGTRRGSPYDHEDGPQRVQATFTDMGLDALLVIGGNGSLSVACKLHQDLGLPIIGVPKTIDNDVVGTDMTFGFNTAVQIATDAIDRLHTTAESHDRVMVVEVMGRHSGWIATYAGIAGGATAILIPEEPFDIDKVCELFPRLGERLGSMGNLLSGGEQQMLAVGRALMTNPRLLILDEATEGLAPLIRAEIWSCLTRLKARGQSILVIDKNVEALTRIADRHYLIERGRAVWSGTSAELAAAPNVQHQYLGI